MSLREPQTEISLLIKRWGEDGVERDEEEVERKKSQLVHDDDHRSVVGSVHKARVARVAG